jgi:hypothetical protein
MTHEDAIRLMQQRFEGPFSAADWDRMAEHLRGCAACRARYQELRAPWLEAEGRPATDTQLTARELAQAATFALERAEGARVAAAAVAALPVDIAGNKPRTKARRAVLGAMAGATAVFGVVLYASVDMPGPGPSRTPRGSDDSAFGPQLMCFKREAPREYLILKQSGTCPAGSFVKLQASSLDPTTLEVSAVALSDDLRPLRVFHATLSDSRPVTFEGYLELGQHRRIGVAFVFSQKPVTEATLLASVARAGRERRNLAELETVPLPEAVTQKLLVIEAEAQP